MNPFPRDSENKIRNFAIWWNNVFVVDYWYRKKYNIRFNSLDHRQISPLDILFEWEEDQITTIVNNNKIDEENHEDYKKTGDWLIAQKTNQELEEEFYENFNFEDFDDIIE